ncbi:MAG TPA: glucokinase [Candidatus Deferrimicrobiaceae bacterium]|nr:glucokinase [Candidatus Deferrimicrobiaceae bacterium]
MRILAGDVGGTKTNLALYLREGSALRREELRSFPSGRYPALEAILAEFLAGSPGVDSVCIGVAGPVVSGRSRVTNLPWVVDGDSVKKAVGARRAYLINDLQATAFSVPFLSGESLAVLQGGEAEPRGTIAVIAAGTGLGAAFLVWGGAGYLPVASEAGHADFAPRDEREMRLFRYLKGRHGRASVERALSGPGLHAVYRFLRESEKMAESPEVVARLAAEDPPRVIAQEGISGGSDACREALRVFSSLYGAQAGNFALQVMAMGGVYLGGGIAPAILPALSEGPFLESFLAKGRFREFLARVPVRVIRDDKAALLGAARYAFAGEGVDG